MLRALAVVDAVHIVADPTAIPLIQAVQPDVYVKGLDWLERPMDPALLAETAAVAAAGGRIAYVGPTLYSSSALINRRTPPAPPLRAVLQATGLTPATFRDAVEALSSVRAVVIGDEILDAYHTVTPLGLTAKTPVLSLRHVGTEYHDGGVLAVRRHAAAFSDQVTYLPSGRAPVVKARYVSPASFDQPLTKHFGVNHLPPPALWDEAGYCDRLRASLATADVVIVADFGHGTMTDAVRTIVQDAPCLAVNCQTNSANHGFNVLNRQYASCDAFVMDRTELALAVGHPTTDAEADLRALAHELTAQYAVLTRGDEDTIGILNGGATWSCPALERQPVDTLGAGDACFALIALAVAKDYPLPVVMLLGQLAGAQAVRVVGNRVGVDKSALVAHGMALLAGLNDSP